MATGLLGKKLGMTQVYDSKGRMIPVTVIQAGPCYVLQVKTAAADGYNAVQLGFDSKKDRNVIKPERGLMDKVNGVLREAAEPNVKVETVAAPRFIREIRVADPAAYQVGQRLDVDVFAIGEKVDIIGTSKGRGFAGVVKRHHSKPGPVSHGSMYHRRPGSMGGSSWPSRVYKGKPLPGHMGAQRSTTLNLVVVQADPTNHLIAVRGSVPGHINGYVIIRKNVRGRKG